jgi:hypothetical protein
MGPVASPAFSGNHEGDLVPRLAGVSTNSGGVSWLRSQRLRPMQQVRPVMLAPALSAAALPAVPGLQPEPGLR